MKLSELFKTPFKLKGGGTLNLRGYSKRIIDKEIQSNKNEDDEDEDENTAITNLLNLYYTVLPHPTKVANAQNYNLVNISDIDGNFTGYFLYKQSDITNITHEPTKFVIEDDYFNLVCEGNTIHYTYTIDGEAYVVLGEEIED